MRKTAIVVSGALVLGFALIGCSTSWVSGDLEEDPLAPIDHVVIGVPELGDGVRDIADRTGVRPAPGGEHPGVGTHNALLSLGDDKYLELIAPRPGVPLAERWQELPGLRGPTPVTWVVRSRDIERTQRILELNGYETEGPVAGSRVRPDGVVLEWKVLHITKPEIEGAPFFIQWGRRSPHPSGTSPAGCRLRRFKVSASNPSRLRRLFGVLGLKVRVVQGTPGFDVVIDSPHGDVRLGGPRVSDVASGPAEALPADVESVDAVVRASYRALSGRVSELDLPRFRSLFSPDARLARIGARDGSSETAVMAMEEFLDVVRERHRDRAVFEREIARRTETYDRMVHVWSTYEVSHRSGDVPVRRGIRSLQLMHAADRWWIVAALWQGEAPEVPIPAEYLAR